MRARRFPGRYGLATGGALAVIAVLASTWAVAASLGGISPNDLAGRTFPDGRCDQQVEVQPGRQPSTTDPLVYDLLTFTAVAPGCAGLPAQATVRSPDGTALGSGSATAAASTFTVPISPAVAVVDYSASVLVIQGWGITVVPVGSGVSTAVTIDSDWGAGYCADVLVSTTSPTPITWAVDLDLSSYPLNGVPDQVTNATYTWNAPILHASGLSWNATVSVGQPAMWEFCALRGVPPVEPVNTQVNIVSDWGSGYCADVVISTDSTVPVAWDITVSLAAPPVNGVPYTMWNSNWTWSPPNIRATGVGWNSNVQQGQPQVVGFCANR